MVLEDTDTEKKIRIWESIIRLLEETVVANSDYGLF
jgi:hypothetical protein